MKYQKINISILLLLLISVSSTFGQLVTKPEAGPFLLKNATIHTITKGTITGDVLILGNAIVEVSTTPISNSSAKVIDCTGKHIYPGFIDGGTTLGLSEISSVSVTNDFNEIGEIIPQMQALTAVNPNAVAIPVTRTNGVTSALAMPKGGRIPGTAALINLFGYTPEQMYAGFKGVVMNFPSTGRGGRFDRRSDEDVKKDGEKALQTIDDLWEQLAQYSKIDSLGKAQGLKQNEFKPELDALLPVYRGEATLLIEANKSEDIRAALKWIKDKNLKVVLTGVKEGFRVAADIAKAKVPVIVGPVLDNPARSYDKYDAVYTNPSVMQKAGVLVAIRTNNSENVRNLPFNAGFAATYGMGVDEALKAITINPAKIFGLESSLGSIEKGKTANLFICDGDPFEMKTKIEYLFITGWKVALENRHTLLNDEFLMRSPGLKK